MLRIKNQLLDIYQKHTGQKRDKLERDMERDFFLSARDSKEYGLVDEIIETVK
jgi:ATP-dependent Clp protease protease subunit